MPKWDDYKLEAKERGSLAFELYVVRTVPAGDPAAVKAHLPEHLAYQSQMEAEGKLVLAGPMSDESGELMEGVGLVIYRARSFEEARALADNDPMHKAGARSYSLRKWLVNEGSITLTVGLSRQQVALS